MARMVDRLQSHSTGQGTVADDRNTTKILTTVVPGHGHPEGRGNGGTGVTSTEMIEGAFRSFEISGNAVLLTQAVEIVETTGDQLVGIGLMAHIPDHLVPVEIKGLIERQGEFNHPQTRPQVTTAGGHHFQVPFTDLTGDILQLRQA